MNTTERSQGPLPAAIRGIRGRMGMSRAQFAEKIGCPENTVAIWELGRIAPGAGRLIRLLWLAETPSEAAPIRAHLQKIGIEPDSITSPTISKSSANDSMMPPAA